MKKTDNWKLSNTEMVTISRAEYEKLQAQSKRVSELESRVDLLNTLRKCKKELEGNWDTNRSTEHINQAANWR